MKRNEDVKRERDARRMTRRSLLAAAGAVGAAALAGERRAVAAQDAARAARRPGRLPNKLGQRSTFEQPMRDPTTTSSRTPLQDLHGTITPSDLHFERHHSGVPEIDPALYRLVIHGMVERPTVLSLDDLERFPSVSRIYFLECAGNFRRERREETTPQGLCGLTSQSEWTGVLLSTIFREIGAQPQATWFLAEGQDAALMTRSIPVEKAWEDAMIAYAQNGEALRPEQGYPARLLLPGWEGNSSVKWLRRIELSNQPFMTREETSKYTDPLGDGTARQFSFVMDTRSVITSPCFPQTIRPGWIEIRGLAWSGRGRIDRVEVSTDGGQTWQRAALQEPVLPKAHCRFRHLWSWNGQPTEMLSRAIDETGYMQPTWDQLMSVRGRRTRYHQNPITSWKIGADGRVVFGIERVGG